MTHQSTEISTSELTRQADVLPEASAGEWYVLHARSRQEKILADELAARGVGHFLPLIRQVRYYGRRKAVIDAPIFPGYVFLRGTIEQAYAAERTRRIAKIIPVNDQKRLDWELKNLAGVLDHQPRLDTYPALRKGVRVEVRSGPFRGLQGMIEDRLRDDRLILQVAMLGRAVSLETDGALLEPLD